MAWEDLYRRAIGLRKASFYVNVTATIFAFWTMIVTVSVIRQLDALSESLSSGDSGIVGFTGAFSPAPKFVDYASGVSFSIMTYAIVTVLLFLTGYLLKALGLLAEIAVLDLDLGLDSDEEVDAATD